MHVRLSAKWVTSAIVGGALALICSAPGLGQQSATAQADQAFYKAEVRPLLEKHCLSCHSGTKPAGGLDLTRREGLLKGGPSGGAILPTDLPSSLILKAIHYEGPQMPPSGKMPGDAIITLTKWVNMGAPYASSARSEEAPKPFKPPQVNAETMKFWSFQPIRNPQIPSVKNRAWVKSPIDAFILQKLDKNHLTPAAPAARTALIRRAYYDLIGLPPTPEEVRAFVADSSPKAYERVIDRLLASPQYGEKWGRHWLDLVHFAETNSYERDGVKPNAWRYRDYVINAFNQDKPYNQFVLEQLAGDELPNRTPEKLIATGYYRLGIWDDEPSDHDQALYDDMDDIVRTTSETFLGLTVGCARCHDHKIDPIPQKDYYSFVSFFAGVNRYGPQAQRSIASEEEQQKQKLDRKSVV